MGQIEGRRLNEAIAERGTFKGRREADDFVAAGKETPRLFAMTDFDVSDTISIGGGHRDVDTFSKFDLLRR
jgi:hypothetical protein